jgi:hypothetical protein
MSGKSRKSLEEILKGHPVWVLGGVLITGLSTGVFAAEWRLSPQIETLVKYEEIGTVAHIKDKAESDRKEIIRLEEALRNKGGCPPPPPAVTADQVELVVCPEGKEDCPGVVKACVLADDPDHKQGQVRLASRDYPIKYDHWFNKECDTNGHGWYARDGSCGGGKGTLSKKCQYVIAVQIK